MKRLIKSVLTAACLLAVANPAAAKGLVDCPLRDAPYSVSSPLIDVLLNPKARVVAEKALPGLSTKMPPMFKGTTPPTFASILTLKEAAGFMRMTSLDLAPVDRELAVIPITRADRVARCARYDVMPPKLAVPTGKLRVLMFEKINGFRDGPSVDAAHAAFVSMAKRNHWGLVSTLNGAAFTPAVLRKFDVVIWNNISGDVLTMSQRAAFKNWMEHGGGFVGVHGSAGDPVYFWDWYVDNLLGARFLSHPMGPQFQDARVVVTDPKHPAVKGLPAEWTMNDEWYSFKTNPRAAGSRIIATLDESTYKPVGMNDMDLRMGDHPIVWSRCIGAGAHAGRMFYSAIGHRPERYSDAIYVQMLEQAVVWTGAHGGCSAH
ncbi:MAG: ThuA domain-containing protein [Novosphingobium sp.]